MNCVKGDLAYIFRVPDGDQALLGKFVTCAELTQVAGKPAWVFESPIYVEYAGKAYRVFGALDAHLRPVRDPGDDAVDETLLWRKETSTAG